MRPVGSHPWIPTEQPLSISYDEASAEITKWNKLQENFVSNLIQSMRNIMHSSHPERYISAAVSPDVHLAHYLLQDWNNWIPHAVDYVTPMSYTSSITVFQNYCLQYDSLELLQPCRCFPGIGAFCFDFDAQQIKPVSYTHLTLPTN